MVTGDIDGVRRYVQEKMDCLPRIEEKLESYNNKILYLVKRINQLQHARNGSGELGHTRATASSCRATEGYRPDGRIHRRSRVRKAESSRSARIGGDKKNEYDFPIGMIESFLDNVIG